MQSIGPSEFTLMTADCAIRFPRGRNPGMGHPAAELAADQRTEV